MDDLPITGFDLENGALRWFGLPLQQRPFIFEYFNYFFNTTSADNVYFDRIIELGTGSGVLTICLGLYAASLDGCRVYTFDIHDHIVITAKDILCVLGVSMYTADVLDDDNTAGFVKELIESSGRVLLICDNGSKDREFNLYAPSLKTGDFIKAHDYIETYELYKREFENRIWNCCGITYQNIEDVCDKMNLSPYMQEYFRNVVWICMRKI